MCVNAGGGLNNLALLDFSSFLTDVVNRRQWRSNVDADVWYVDSAHYRNVKRSSNIRSFGFQLETRFT